MLPTASALIDECQRSVGEQRHRALQDLIVMVGRLLQFEITFGTYERSADAVKVDGQWRSPGRLDVVLEIRTDQTTSATLDGLARATAEAPGATARAADWPVRGRAAVRCACQAQPRARRDPTAGHPCDHASARCWRSPRKRQQTAWSTPRSSSFCIPASRSISSSTCWIGRRRTASRANRGGTRTACAGQRSTSRRTWIATITGSEAAPEQLLASVIAERRVLAICPWGKLRGEGSPGDWVGFFVPGKGLVGHAQLASIVDDSAKVVRHAQRFSCVYRLEHMTLYERPMHQALRADRRFAVPPADVALVGPCLAPIARQDFLALTAFGDGAENAEGPRSATA